MCPRRQSEEGPLRGGKLDISEKWERKKEEGRDYNWESHSGCCGLCGEISIKFKPGSRLNSIFVCQGINQRQNGSAFFDSEQQGKRRVGFQKQNDIQRFKERNVSDNIRQEYVSHVTKNIQAM